GNHDAWHADFLAEFMGAEIVPGPQTRTLFGRRFHFAHGDGLGRGDVGYKILKKTLRNRAVVTLFRTLHPDFGWTLGDSVSETRRNARKMEYVNSLPDDHPLVEYSRTLFQRDPDLHAAVYGHLHCLKRLTLENRTIFVLGDWIKYFSFLKICEHGEELCQYAD
ncbi:MAG: hypothetical protein NZ534_06190, partial [Bacteroidia bacterium]|nr:hypothetical protein [Bacteroidia bacterium]